MSDEEFVAPVIRKAVAEAGGNEAEAWERVAVWLEAVTSGDALAQILEELMTRHVLFSKEHTDIFCEIGREARYNEWAVVERFDPRENPDAFAQFGQMTVAAIVEALHRWVRMECRSFRNVDADEE